MNINNNGTENSGKKADVFILTGFLGAGKTTLLSRILSWDRDYSKTIVIVNEFGKIGIDGTLIKNTAGREVVELVSGCICCSLKNDLLQTLESVWEEFQPDTLFIEATGVADPLAIIAALKEPGPAKHYHLKKTITVLDADFWDAREAFGLVFFSQLKEADILLFNKVDTIEKNDLSNFLEEIKKEAPRARVIPTTYCRMDKEILWAEEQKNTSTFRVDELFQVYDPSMDLGTDPASKIGGSPGQTGIDAHVSGFISFSVNSSQDMDKELFKQFVRDLPLKIFRIKGPIRMNGTTSLLNYVGGKSQWQEWQGDKETSLAFVGWDIKEEDVIKKLNNCFVD